MTRTKVKQEIMGLFRPRECGKLCAVSRKRETIGNKKKGENVSKGRTEKSPELPQKTERAEYLDFR